MMAELWSDIERDLAFCRRHLSTAVDLFRSPRFEKEDATWYFDEMAFMHMMQSGYTSFEPAMKRLLGLLGEELPRGSDWHADLLRRLRFPVEGARPEIIDEKLFRAADDGAAFSDVWHRAERGETVEDRALVFESWDALAKVLTGERDWQLKHVHAHPEPSVSAKPLIASRSTPCPSVSTQPA